MIFTIIFVIKRSKGSSWNNIDPASQTVAQHYISIGPMHRVSGVSGAGMLKRHQHNVTVRKPNAVSMTGQRRRLWVNIETALVECHVFAQSIQHTR